MSFFLNYWPCMTSNKFLIFLRTRGKSSFMINNFKDKISNLSWFNIIKVLLKGVIFQRRCRMSKLPVAYVACRNEPSYDKRWYNGGQDILPIILLFITSALSWKYFGCYGSIREDSRAGIGKRTFRVRDKFQQIFVTVNSLKF